MHLLGQVLPIGIPARVIQARRRGPDRRQDIGSPVDDDDFPIRPLEEQTSRTDRGRQSRTSRTESTDTGTDTESTTPRNIEDSRRRPATVYQKIGPIRTRNRETTSPHRRRARRRTGKRSAGIRIDDIHTRRDRRRIVVHGRRSVRTTHLHPHAVLTLEGIGAATGRIRQCRPGRKRLGLGIVVHRRGRTRHSGSVTYCLTG